MHSLRNTPAGTITPALACARWTGSCLTSVTNIITFNFEQNDHNFADDLSNAFSRRKCSFIKISLHPSVWLTINQHWLRWYHYQDQLWLTSLTHIWVSRPQGSTAGVFSTTFLPQISSESCSIWKTLVHSSMEMFTNMTFPFRWISINDIKRQCMFTSFKIALHIKPWLTE